MLLLFSGPLRIIIVLFEQHIRIVWFAHLWLDVRTHRTILRIGGRGLAIVGNLHVFHTVLSTARSPRVRYRKETRRFCKVEASFLGRESLFQ